MKAVAPIMIFCCSAASRHVPAPQGYVEAAQTFQQESMTQPGIDLAAITDRMEIRKAVQSGNVEEAIERVNDLNPEVCTMPSSQLGETYVFHPLSYHVTDTAFLILARIDESENDH